MMCRRSKQNTVAPSRLCQMVVESGPRWRSWRVWRASTRLFSAAAPCSPRATRMPHMPQGGSARGRACVALRRDRRVTQGPVQRMAAHRGGDWLLGKFMWQGVEDMWQTEQVRTWAQSCCGLEVPRGGAAACTANRHGTDWGSVLYQVAVWGRQR